MITHLHGILAKKSPTEIVIDIQGIGYAVQITLTSYQQLPEPNEAVNILIYHHFREDAQVLYGFIEESEREMFKLLISVSGIGPKMAQTILSGVHPDELIRTISHNAISSLTTIPGVGKKTAERMIVELKDKVVRIEGNEKNFEIPSSSGSVRNEALTALISLGISREKAEQSLRNILNELNGSSISVEDLIKRVLQHSGK